MEMGNSQGTEGLKHEGSWQGLFLRTLSVFWADPVVRLSFLADPMVHVIATLPVCLVRGSQTTWTNTPLVQFFFSVGLWQTAQMCRVLFD